MSHMARMLCSLLIPGAAAAAAAADVKHAVVIISDDQGWNDVGWRNAAIKTPTLDAMAAAGVVLSNYYTHEVCSPSRGAMLTGRFAYRLGFQGVISSAQRSGVPLAVPMVGEILKDIAPAARAHAVGKWHAGMFCDKMAPTARGFDSFFGYLDGAEDYTAHGTLMTACGNGTAAAPFALDLWNGTVPATGWDGVYSSSMYSHVIADIIQKHDAAAPLFLYAAFQNVHEPIYAPEPYQKMYAGATNSSERAMFMADVSALDAAVANITKALAAKGMLADTLLFFSTDNGANLHGGGNNWPLRGGKWSTWEGGIHASGFVALGSQLPLQPAPAGAPPPANYTGLMHCADIVPTVLAAMGLELGRYGGSMDGQNAWPALAAALGVGGAPPSAEERVIVHKMSQKDAGSPAFAATLRVGDMKLHIGFPGEDKAAVAQGCRGGCWCPVPDPFTGNSTCVRLDDAPAAAAPCADSPCLYNITADPLEMHDLAASRPALIARMVEQARALRADLVESAWLEGSDWDGSCANLHQTGAWGPWVQGAACLAE